MMRLKCLTPMLIAATLSAADFGSVNGSIQDARGNVLAGAEIQAQNESTGTRWRTLAGKEGNYTLTGLAPGSYRVRVRMNGYRTASRGGVEIGKGKSIQLDFGMEMIALHETITVSSGHDEIDPANGDTLLLTRDSPGAALPNNGRDFRSSFDLMPGVIITPAGVSDAGQFTSQGQRPNSNTFRLDGVSANTGTGGSTLPGSLPGASLPAMNAIGSTENLVSPEATQSVELRTSNFAPEYGERPGSQVLVTTRSGSTEFHGSLSGHGRDNSWTAQDWFANSRGVSYPRSMYGNLSGTFGGPIWRNRTFFFLSGDASAMRDTGMRLTSVPSFEARKNAPDALKTFLQNFPQPIGPDFGNGQAEGLMSMSRYALLTNLSARVDHAIGSNGNLFGRYTRSPSYSSSQQFSITQGVFNWQSATVGFTLGKPEGMIHDVRVNFSRANFNSLPAALPLDATSLFVLAGFLPDPNVSSLRYPIWSSAMALSIPGLGQFTWGDWGATRQDQVETRYSVSLQRGNHQFRGGVDYLHLSPVRKGGGDSTLGIAPSLQSILDGTPIPLQYSSFPRYRSKVNIGSMFVQDTFRIRPSLSIVYGVRWEVTPPVKERFTLSTYPIGLDEEGRQGFVDNFRFAGTTIWPMRYSQLAPRIGIAYRLPSNFVLRSGTGLFFDTRLGATVNPINGAPFNSWFSPGGGGLSNPNPKPPNMGMTPDVERYIAGPYPELRLPVSYQWRTSIEKNVYSRGIASIAYLGTLGRNLLGNQMYIDSNTGYLRQFTMQTQSRSNYQAMELRYSGSITRSLYGSLAYTWGHSLDDASQDSSVFLVHPGYQLNEARASSSFDVRQAVTAALSYRIPATKRLPWSLTNWTVSGIFRLRTGFPINVVNQEQPMGRNFVNVGRPDLIPGVPVWIDDAKVAGRNRLNSSAFAIPPSGREGTLGRNAVTGRGLQQIDLSLRRDFSIGRTSLQVGINVFNLLNHPSFADPVPFLASPWFGQSTSMQNLMLGSGSPNSGLPAMFQAGGARSAEFNFRFSF